MFIPTDDHAQLVINYYGPSQTFPHYSFVDVIRKRLNPDVFKGKIVLVGFTGSTYQDWHSTPFKHISYPGVEVHATLIENMLRGDFLHRPGWTTLLDALVILGLGAALGIALPARRIAHSLAKCVWGVWRGVSDLPFAQSLAERRLSAPVCGCGLFDCDFLEIPGGRKKESRPQEEFRALCLAWRGCANPLLRDRIEPVW